MTEQDLRQEWETPADFFTWLDTLFRFNIDVCATKDNAKCKPFLSLADGDDALQSPWGCEGTRAFCNPGFANLEPWLSKAASETYRNNMTAVVLSHAGLATKWFQEYAPLADQIWLPSPRVQYVAPPGIKQTSNPRDTLVWIFTPWGHIDNSAHIVPVEWK